MLNNLKPYIVIGAATITLLIILWAVLMFLQKQTSYADHNAAKLIPSDAYLVINSNDPQGNSERLRETIFWKELTNIDKIDEFNQSLIFLDSVINISEKTQKLSEESTLWISFHNIPQNNNAVLFNINLNRRHKLKNVTSFLEKNFNFSLIKKHSFIDKDIFESKFYEEKEVFITLYKNSLLISKHKRLIERAITQYKSGKNILSNEDFAALKDLTGENTNVYYDLKSLCRNLNKITKSGKHPFFDCNKFDSWLSWDIHIYDQTVSFYGFLLPGKDKQPVFMNKEPRELSVLSGLPSSTLLLISKSTKDSKTTDYNTNSCLVNQTAHAYFVNDIHAGTISSILILQTENRKDASSFVRNQDLKEISAEKIFSEKTDLNIYEAPKDQDFKDVAGHKFNNKFKYIIKAENLLIAMPDIHAAKNWYRFYNNRQTLLNDLNNQNIREHLPMYSNFFVYINIPGLISFMDNSFTKETRDFLKENSQYIENFDKFAFQISHHRNRLFQNNAVINHDPYSLNIPEKNWETLLDTTVNKKLFNVVSHVDQSEEIIVADKNNILYLINDKGEVLWSRELPEAIMSEIYQVDYYKNNKYQYLFNTKNYIFLIDRLGRDVADYPLKLTKPASAPMALFDYENNKEYRLLIPTEDKTILNLDKTGSPVYGWLYDKSNDTVRKPVQHIRMDEKDFLIVTDITGKPEILNRRGQTRIKIPEKLKISQKNPVYFDTTGSKKPHFILSGKKGEIIKITIEGKVSEFAIDVFTDDHFFLYNDITLNEKKDFLIVDKNILYVYDSSGKKMFSHKFDGFVENRPVIFNINNNMKLIGIVDKKNKKAYLFNSTGQNLTPFIKSNVTFIIKRTDKSNNIEVIKGLDNIIRSYQISS